MKEVGALVAGGYALAAVASQSTVLTDIQALAVAAAAGLFGGILATFWGNDPLTWRRTIVTIMASVGFSIALVYGWLIYPQDGEDLALKLWPVGISVPCGLFAWVIFAKLMALVEGLTLKEIKQHIVDFLTRGGGK